MLNFFKGKKKTNTKGKFVVNKEIIDRAYERRIKDIDSLRKYDRGEKEIHAPNLRDIVPSIRRSA